MTVTSAANLNVDGFTAFHADSPAALAATENDYAGIARSFARLTPDAAGSTITGIQGGSDGRLLYLVNLGNANLTIANQSAASAVQNRIITGTGADVVVPADETMTLLYDATTARWRRIA